MARIDSSIPFRGEPLACHDGVPRFCELNPYVANYQRIASDHVAAIKPGAANPFIEEKLWDGLERSTQTIIARHLPAGSAILDVGVGLGRLLDPLVQFDRYGVDISQDYLVRARDVGIQVAFARAEELPFADSVFDAVVACDVLEHVPDLSAVCREMLRVLKAGGLLVVRVPSKEDLSVYLREDLPYEFIHLRNFDLAGLRLLFGKIFGMTFVEGSEVCPFLQGAARLQLRLLPEATRLAMATMVPGLPQGPSSLRLDHAFEISEETFCQWMYWLRDHHPEHFAAVAPHLLLGMGVNVAFRKPTSPTAKALC